MPANRTIIVCADTPLDWFTASEILDDHLLPSGTPRSMYPVRRRPVVGWVSRWSPRHLIHPTRRRGAVAWAAGGPKARLDLTAAVTMAAHAAMYRWRLWSHVVRGTAAATPWRDYLARHLADPHRLPLEEARRRFEAQPRILAMLAHNTHPDATVALDMYEVDAYQAGEATYTALHWQRAIAGDAMVTTDGRLLEPATDSLADTLRYLADAGNRLRSLPRQSHLAAIAVTA